MFVGPTGVGKTELARSLADFLFDDEGRLTHWHGENADYRADVGN
jgi:ATP-dependent Clp protease ATP-binding subunit ClpA